MACNPEELNPWLSEPNFYKGNDALQNVSELIRRLTEMKNNGEEIPTDSHGKNVLHFFIVIADENHFDTIPMLDVFLQSPVFSLYDQSPDGSYPIHYSITASKPGILKRLLEHEIHFDNPRTQTGECWQCLAVDNHGETPLHLAARGFKTIFNKEIVEILLNQDTLSVHAPNEDKLTPIHLAVKLNNRVAFDIIYQKYKEEDKIFLQAGRRPLLHYVCSLRCKSKFQKQMLRDVLQHPDIKRNLNKVWWYGTNALETAVTNNQLYTVRKLLQQEDIQINTSDTEGSRRTAIFYAAMNGMTSNGNSCVKKLLHRKEYDASQLLKNKDEDGMTVLDYVQAYCPPDTVKNLLNTVLGKGRTFNHEQLMTAYPDQNYGCESKVFQHVLDNSFSYTEPQNGIRQLQMDISCVTAKPKKQQKVTNRGQNATFSELFSLERARDTQHIHNCIPQWNSKEREAILKHPASSYFVFFKSLETRRSLRTLLIFQLMWMMLVIIYASFLIWEDYIAVVIMSGVMLSYAMISLVYEVYEMCYISKYWSNKTNYVQLTRDFLLIISAILGFIGDILTAKSFASVGILCASVLIMRHLRHIHPFLGKSVDIFRQVVLRVVKVLLSCFPITMAFVVAFHMLFRNTLSATAQPFIHSLYNVFIMMGGEIDLDKMNPTNPTTSVWHMMAKNAIFITFFIAIVLAFFNYLTGVALAKVQRLHDKADVRQVISKIECIYFIETVEGFKYAIELGIQKIWSLFKQDDSNNGKMDETPQSVVVMDESMNSDAVIVKTKLRTPTRTTGLFERLWNNFPHVDWPNAETIKLMHSKAAANHV